MNVINCEIQGLVIIEPKVFGDARGFFMETWNRQRYRAAGLDWNFVQDNVSLSRRGTLRGLHFQNPAPQGKLVFVLQGEVFDVAVDIRRSSPTFGRWHGERLSSETALFAYKCTELYSPQHELTLAWNDPDIGIQWPLENPQLSEKDTRGLRLKDLPPDRLFA